MCLVPRSQICYVNSNSEMVLCIHSFHNWVIAQNKYAALFGLATVIQLSCFAKILGSLCMYDFMRKSWPSFIQKPTENKHKKERISSFVNWSWPEAVTWTRYSYTVTHSVTVSQLTTWNFVNKKDILLIPFPLKLFMHYKNSYSLTQIFSKILVMLNVKVTV